jgi:hypothetical protein
MLPAIGSLSALNSGGRLGVVVDARPRAEPADGRQLAALQLRTVDQRDAQGQAAARVSGLAPLPAEATERPGASRRTLASRDERAAAALARLPEPRPERAGDLAGPIEEVSHHGPDGRPHAVGGSLDTRSAATTGEAAELRRFGGRPATVSAPTDPPPRDFAVARLGHRLYAEAQSNRARGVRVESGSPERTRGGRVDLTF